MVNSNKVLTVSYGTFSCTLEGFDDSFGMMKAIAEYFRDLAADDRYFGAEPPTPDAEMLARIAEREVERRVEARLEKGNIVLRPSLDAPTTAETAPAAVAAGAAVAGMVATAADANADTTDADATNEDTETSEAADQVPSDDLDTSADDETLADAAFAAMAAPVAETAAPVSGSVMDKLQRIRAVVSNAPTEPSYVEDQHADSLGGTDATDRATIASLVAEEDDTPLDYAEDATAPDAVAEAELEALEESLAEDDADDDIADSTLQALLAEDEDEDDDALASELDALDALDDGDDAEADEDDDEPVAWDTDVAEEDDEDDGWDVLDGIRDEFTDDDDDEVDTDAVAEADEDDDDTDNLSGVAALAAGAAGIAGAATARPLTAPTLRAQVTKVNREAFDDAVNTGQVQDVTPAVPDPVEVPLSDTSTLQPEDEEDLALELARLEAEIESEQAELEAQGAWSEDDEAELEDDLDDDWDDDDLDDVAEDEDDDILGEDDWDDEDDDVLSDEDDDLWDDDDEDEDLRSVAAQDDDDDWDDYDEEDAEEDRKWAEAEARIKAEQEALARAEAEDDADDEDEDDDNRAAAEKAREQADMEATIDRLARESVRKTVKLTSPARVMLTESKVEEGDTSVSRLLNQTDSEMSEPEGNRRRSAIAHLRAAVAATRADRILGRRRDEEKEKAAYQEDLQDAVRPRRPSVAGTPRSERPKVEEPAAAPLQLVNDQRIDDAEAQSVRPRRIGADALSAQDDADDGASGFQDFARSVGAHDLPELLEAAAAYISFVEGRDQFSRPQLMSKVRQAEEEESSREDRLRCFSQLLRQGKIEKTRGGRFTASSNIGFRPGDRAAS